MQPTHERHHRVRQKHGRQLASGLAHCWQEKRASERANDGRTDGRDEELSRLHGMGGGRTDGGRYFPPHFCTYLVATERARKRRPTDRRRTVNQGLIVHSPVLFAHTCICEIKRPLSLSFLFIFLAVVIEAGRERENSGQSSSHDCPARCCPEIIYCS